jgi:secretion/DNA translocation related TadE-like protein
MTPKTSERGSVSVVAAAVVLVVLVCTMGIADVARALVARAQARAAADAAALAAAQELAFPSGESPAEQARLFAERNGADLLSCVCEVGSFDAVVTVRGHLDGLLLVPGVFDLDVTARAVVDLPTPAAAPAPMTGEGAGT